MAAKLSVKGMDDLLGALQSVSGDSDGIIAKAMYDAVGTLKDEVIKNIRQLPEDPGYKKTGVQRAVVTPDEKQDLIEHLGIATFTKRGGKISTAIGFNGYSRHKTKKYPGGVPIPMIARSIESGSSVRIKHPFVRNAASAVKDRISQDMQQRISDEIRTIMGGQ